MHIEILLKFTDYILDVQCKQIPLTLDAVIDTTDTGYGVTVTVTCNHGYIYPDQSRQRSITCMSDGQWDSLLSPCEGIVTPTLEY